MKKLFVIIVTIVLIAGICGQAFGEGAESGGSSTSHKPIQLTLTGENEMVELPPNITGNGVFIDVPTEIGNSVYEDHTIVAELIDIKGIHPDAQEEKLGLLGAFLTVRDSFLVYNLDIYLTMNGTRVEQGFDTSVLDCDSITVYVFGKIRRTMPILHFLVPGDMDNAGFPLKFAWIEQSELATRFGNSEILAQITSMQTISDNLQLYSYEISRWPAKDLMIVADG